MQNKFKYIFFDADDTLWENERYFREAEQKFALLLSSYADENTSRKVLEEKQEENIPIFGYGSKTYLIGMMDAAVALCGEKMIDTSVYSGINKIIRELSYHEVKLIEGVEETLERLQDMRLHLAVATKGDLMEQMTKYRKSGLAKYFHHIEVMENKDEQNYRMLAAKMDIAPEDLIMIGNSVKSDIAPVVNIGGTAVHIPHEITWAHEMMEMPQSGNIIEIEKITDLPEILLEKCVLA